MGVDVNMLATTNKVLSQEDIRVLSYRICEAFGHDEFWQHVKAGKFALSAITKEDYPYEWLSSNVAERAGTILEVNQLWRYYGPGYERGPLPTIIGVAEWLKRNGFEVWYGGDSGDRLDQLDAKAISELWDHFAKHGGEPYHSAFSASDPKAVCPYHQQSMVAYKWGGYHSFVEYVCPGCGYKCKTDDNGLTFTTVQEPS